MQKKNTTSKKELLHRTTSTYYDENEDEKPPSCWYIVDAMGDMIFIRKRNRGDAQKVIDEEYGKGFYTVRAYYIKKGNGNISAK